LKELKKLYNFLELNENESKVLQSFNEIKSNISDDHFKQIAKKDILSRFRQYKVVNRIVDTMPDFLIKFFKNKIMSYINKNEIHKKFQPKQIDNVSSEFLKDYYLTPTKELSKFTNRDLIKLWKL